MIEIQKGARGRRRSGRLSRSDALATATEPDWQLIKLVSQQRVVTQTQLERLFNHTPARTLRYRTERLTKLGLLGRSRPYRDKGSAPFHYWPTRVADAFARGEPVPYGGERPEPNPAFLAHAAGLSELYVLLAAQAPAYGLRPRGFQREGDAREPFCADGRARALAPDALVDVEDEQGRQLLAFVELDLGTMSHARLKTKAGGYAAYSHASAWTGRHPFCPALLFLATTEARALAFLKLLAAELQRLERGGYAYEDERQPSLAAAACAHARMPERALAEPCWDDLTLSGGGLMLRDCLEAARAPYDERCAREQAKQRIREERLARLRADPTALRAHLHERRCADLYQRLERFGEQEREALYLLLESERPLSDAERHALAALADYLGEELLQFDYELQTKTPSAAQAAAVARLLEQTLARERAQVETLARQHGELPCLRRARRELAAGKLLGRYNDPAASVRHELAIAHEQSERRERYLTYREREARHRAREFGPLARLRHGHERFAAAVDRDLLRVCERCGELIYPDLDSPQRFGRISPADTCPYCTFAGRLRTLGETGATR